MRARRTSPWTSFRGVAIAEGVSWLALLISIVIDVASDDSTALQVFAPILFVVFLFYLLTAFAYRRPLGWSRSVLLWALLASVPPFGTLVFARWAERTGRLQAAHVAR